MRLLGHVAHMEEMRNAYRILDGTSEGRNYLRDLDIDGRMILK
jgi:hypothetical protein